MKKDKEMITIMIDRQILIELDKRRAEHRMTRSCLIEELIRKAMKE